MRATATVAVLKADSRVLETTIDLALENALNEVGKAIMERVEIVAGTQYFTYDELEALGYPYARRDPHPPTPPGYINKQDGAFYAGFNLKPAYFQRNGLISIGLENTDEKAALLSKGNDYMIGRYYGAAIMKGIDFVLITSVVNAMSPYLKVQVKRS